MDDCTADIDVQSRWRKFSGRRSLRIFGIDPGVATLGWGVVDAHYNEKLKITPLEYGVVKTEKGIPQPERLVDLKRDISEVLLEFKPDVISIERLFFCRNQKTAIAVGEARGVVLLAVGEAGGEVMEYTPLQVKSMICNSGRAVKKEVESMVQLILMLDEIPKPDDAADALALAICAAQDIYLILRSEVGK